jgi:hypothetical protein
MHPESVELPPASSIMRSHLRQVVRRLSLAVALFGICACRPSGDAAILYDMRAAGAAWVKGDSSDLAQFMDVHGLLTQFFVETSDSTTVAASEENAAGVARLLWDDAALQAARDGVSGNTRAGMTVFWRLSPRYASSSTDPVELLLLTRRGGDTATVGLIARLPESPERDTLKLTVVQTNKTWRVVAFENLRPLQRRIVERRDAVLARFAARTDSVAAQVLTPLTYDATDLSSTRLVLKGIGSVTNLSDTDTITSVLYIFPSDTGRTSLARTPGDSASVVRVHCSAFNIAPRQSSRVTCDYLGKNLADETGGAAVRSFSGGHVMTPMLIDLVGPGVRRRVQRVFLFSAVPYALADTLPLVLEK